jgi:hypothetical protein
VRGRTDLHTALREIRARSGIGYKAFEVKAKRLVQAGTVPAAGADFAANPLPNSSLHRAIENGNLRWFATVPARLELFLRVAGCPEPELERWLDKLRQVGEPAGPEPPGPPRAGPPERTGNGRRWALLAAAALATVALIFLAVLASYGQFYGALGLDIGDLPIGVGRLALSTVIVIAVLVGVAVFLLGGFVTGLALVPWPARTRATVPAAALTAGLFLAAFAVPIPAEGVKTAVVAVAGVVMMGAHLRLLTGQRVVQVLAGWVIAVGTVGTIFAVALAVGRWSASISWLVAVFLTGVAALVLGLRRWLIWQLGRDGLDPPSGVSPAAVLRELRADLLPFRAAELRATMPAWQARRRVTAIGILAVVLPVWALWMIAGFVADAADAGDAARELGYVPTTQESLIWTPSIRPATVAPRRPGIDPVGVCGGSPEWSASLIAQDGEGSWVLLRATGPDILQVEVAWLPADEYAVRPVLTPSVREGEPWLRPACRP